MLADCPAHRRASSSVSLMLFYSRSYLAARNLFRGEVFVLTLFALLGMLVMISGDQLPDALPRPRADVAVAVRAGRVHRAITRARPRRR